MLKSLSYLSTPRVLGCLVRMATFREAIVSSALNHIGDLGGVRVIEALRTFFTERNERVVLVIDSLDEAHGSDERLRQAESLPWRIMLPSRPRSWNSQLVLDEEDDSHLLGELQALRYPDDVNPFIHQWFSYRPEWGNDLIIRIAGRPDLQEASTIPLILAFYCILGANTSLPDFRWDLYRKVLRRMLTGRWRGNDDSQPDLAACLRTLKGWAWSMAGSDPLSGTGTWSDEVSVDPPDLDGVSNVALDHVATPVDLANVDSRANPRSLIVTDSSFK